MVLTSSEKISRYKEGWNKVKSASISHKEFFEEQMRDPEFAKEYQAAEAEFKETKEPLVLRIKQDLTQKEEANGSLTPSTLERGLEGLLPRAQSDPSEIEKIAKVLGSQLNFPWFSLFT